MFKKALKHLKPVLEKLPNLKLYGESDELFDDEILRPVNLELITL